MIITTGGLSKHMITIAYMNLKGGTAKTVSTINTAAILAAHHMKKVLLVDADSQANLTEFVLPTGADAISAGGLSDLLCGRSAHPRPTKMKNVQVITADDELMELDVTSISSQRSDPMTLRDYLQENGERWDYCLIDCPPAFSAGAMAALLAADFVVIPMKLDAFGIRGMTNLHRQIRNMQRVNSELEIAGVLPTMVYPDGTQKSSLAKLRSGLKMEGIRTVRQVRRSPKVDETTFAQRPLIESSPRGKVTHDYKVFVRDLLAVCEGQGGGETDGV